MSELFFLLVLLACPLAMFLMMRRGHGQGGHSHANSGSGSDDQRLSVTELRRQRRAPDERARPIDDWALHRDQGDALSGLRA